MLAEYHFKIKYIKGIDNTRVDALSRKVELQGNKKVKEAILRINNNKRIRYNYLQFTATQEEPERVYKSLKSF